MSGEFPELLDAFRAAALSVTKLYKTSSQAQTKSRADGYQDCLEDLLSFLDKEGLALADGDGSRVRRWAMERLEGRDAISQTLESEDEVEKPECAASPLVQRASVAPQPPMARNEVQMKDNTPPTVAATPLVGPIVEEADIIVPSQDTFTFQSSVSYPQDAHISLANLDLSDSQTHTPSSRHAPTSAAPRHPRGRNGRGPPRGTAPRVAGQKRKVNLAEFFDVSSLGHGKDVFGNGKRSRLN